MTASVKDIEAIIKRKLDVNVPESLIKKAGLEAEKLSIDLWIKQLNDGIDERGKRIPEYSASYKKWKDRYAKGKIKHRKSSEGKQWYKDLDTTTEYRAKSNKNRGRLTGKAMSAFSVTKLKTSIKDGVIKISYKLFINDNKFKRAAIWRYLEKIGRYYGFAGGNTNRGKKHQNLILNKILTIIFPKANFKNSGKVNIK